MAHISMLLLSWIVRDYSVSSLGFYVLVGPKFMAEQVFIYVKKIIIISSWKDFNYSILLLASIKIHFHYFDLH